MLRVVGTALDVARALAHLHSQVDTFCIPCVCAMCAQHPARVYASLRRITFTHNKPHPRNTQNIVHSDLKARNILLKSSPAEPKGFVAKVGTRCCYVKLMLLILSN